MLGSAPIQYWVQIFLMLSFEYNFDRHPSKGQQFPHKTPCRQVNISRTLSTCEIVKTVTYVLKWSLVFRLLQQLNLLSAYRSLGDFLNAPII